jgi:AP2-associated kinase
MVADCSQIYAGRTQSETRRHQQLPTPDASISPPPVVGAVFSPAPPQQQVIPDIVPMRRGRPTAGAQGHSSKPSPSPMRGTASDPFAALDAKPNVGPVDEISSRFPSLDQFSLLHDGGKFDFDSSSPTTPSHPRDLGQRVTEKLADDAFALPAQSKTPVPPSTKPPAAVVSRAQKIISSNPELQAAASSPSVFQPVPMRPPTSGYVSQGTMTSPTPPPGFAHTTQYNPSPVQRFPTDHSRSSSVPRSQDPAPAKSPYLRPDDPQSLQSAAIPRNSSFSSEPVHARHTSVSSRPSLEGGRPASDALDPITRTKSSNARPRPSSTYLESNMDFLREKEKEASGRTSLSEKRASYHKSESAAVDPSSEEETNIESNVDFLRTMEDNDAAKKDRRRSSGAGTKSKRSSLPSMSLSGTKTLLAGKFGDAFKRFESNTNVPPGPRTPSPLHDMERKDLTPIAGSEATDGRSDDGNILEDMDNMAPEQRRELERRRLSMEEKRVANAAAEYRKRLAERGSSAAPRSIGGVSRAASIQNKVKSLLDENQGASPRKTAEGYGRYTDTVSSPQGTQFEQPPSNPYAKSTITRKPVMPGVVHNRPIPTGYGDLSYAKPRAQIPITAPATVSKTGGPRPSAPPKPMHLNSISTGPQNSPPKHSPLSGRPPQARPDMTPQQNEDYIVDFSKRFPSLSGIEMVERDIERDNRGLRSRDI